MTTKRSGVVSPSPNVFRRRDVAQPGRVRVWGACGRRFKSCHPDRKKDLPSVSLFCTTRLLSTILYPLSNVSQHHDCILLKRDFLTRCYLGALTCLYHAVTQHHTLGYYFLCFATRVDYVSRFQQRDEWNKLFICTKIKCYLFHIVSVFYSAAVPTFKKRVQAYCLDSLLLHSNALFSSSLSCFFCWSLFSGLCSSSCFSFKSLLFFLCKFSSLSVVCLYFSSKASLLCFCFLSSL